MPRSGGEDPLVSINKDNVPLTLLHADSSDNKRSQRSHLNVQSFPPPNRPLTKTRNKSRLELDPQMAMIEENDNRAGDGRVDVIAWHVR